jgi:hypothetical protein
MKRKPTLRGCPACNGKGEVPSWLPFRKKVCPECGGTGHADAARTVVEEEGATRMNWSWVLVFFIAGLASCFAMLASITHFQIFGAVGFFFLMAVCWGFAGGIAGAEN